MVTRLWAGRPGFDFRKGRIYLRHNVKIGSEVHTASYPVDTLGILSGVKRPGREADHSPPSSVEIENALGASKR
jgi:hypothetical protein